MKKLFIIILIPALLFACSYAGEQLYKKLYQDQFPGFTFSNPPDIRGAELSGYEYQSINGEPLVVHSCEQAKDINISIIADYDYFRFKQLRVSCIALEMYSTAGSALTDNFPSELGADLIYQLPATVAPLLSKAELIKKQGQSVRSYDPSTQVTIDRENTFKLLTEEDEVYLSLLARGDFTKDGIEDLLVQSEWYARNAYGKHIDLLILSRMDKESPVKISWRLNTIDK
jgi:hypothetical protein